MLNFALHAASACFAEIHIQASKHLRGTCASQGRSLSELEEKIRARMLQAPDFTIFYQVVIFFFSTYFITIREGEREREKRKEKARKSGRSLDQGSTVQQLLISPWAPGYLYNAQIKS